MNLINGVRILANEIVNHKPNNVTIDETEIKNIFRKQTDKPKERIVYAVTKGTYLGTCLIFVKLDEYPKDGIYAAMAIGDKDGKFYGGMDIMQIPEDAIKD